MLLYVIIPANNEAATVAVVIEAVLRSVPTDLETRVLVVDDGSNDGTADVARDAGASVIRHEHKRGVGAAVRTGVEFALRARTDILLNIDGDGQFDCGDLPRLLGPILTGAADFVTGSRFAPGAKLIGHMPFRKRFGNRLIAWVVRRISGLSISDAACGFRAYNREALLRLNLYGDYTYTQEALITLAMAGVRITEVPITVRAERMVGRSRVAASVLRYSYHAAGIIFTCVRDYRPALIFNPVTFSFALVAALLAGFSVVHWFLVGSLTPHKWASFAAAFLAGMSALVFLFGQLADIISRHRRSHERLLYEIRRDRIEHTSPIPKALASAAAIYTPVSNVPEQSRLIA